MIELPRLAIITPNRRSWRKKKTQPRFSEVVNYVGHSALARVKRKIAWSDVKQFSQAVELVLIYILKDAAAMLSTGRDVTSGESARQLISRAATRLDSSRGFIAQELSNSSPAIRKAIIAAAFAWLRIQFPALNAVSAVAAAGLIQSLLEHRKPA